jgi:general secretion pathway protein G
MKWARKSAPGFTFVELIVATAVMLILASAALPIVRVSIKRQREKDLHFTLREMRLAIDKFKDYADSGRIAQFELNFASEHFPASLEQLVEGVAVANDTTGKKFKFLRRIPIDPMTGRAEWGLRAYQDPPDSKVWGGQSVWDVYSKAEGIGLDGTKYRDW